jgi:hypothetical protein
MYLMNIEQKDVYICYNGADFEWVKRLAEQVESETIDGNEDSRHLMAFFDKWDIAPGQSLIDRMNEGMNSARHVIAVLSPEFLKADWPRFEWKHIVAQDPNNSKGRLIPIRLRDLSVDGVERIDLCAPFRDLRYIDCRKPSEFKRSFVELIRRVRNLPQERGRRLPPLAANAPILPVTAQPEVSWLPDNVPDLLLSNLFPVFGLPSQIWSAATEFREKKEVWEVVPKAEPFILREKRLYTFACLSARETRLREAVDAHTIEKPSSRHDWFIREDRSNWLMALLNSSLSHHLWLQYIKQDGKGRFFFAPGKDNTERKWQMKEGRGRTVAAKKENPATKTSFWVHHAARIKFKRVGERLFLSVEPLYLFTSNGSLTVAGKNAGKLSLLWGGRQQNPDVLRNLLFWGAVLAGNEKTIRISTGDKPIIISPIPASAQLDRGVAFDEIRIKALLAQDDTDLEKAATEIQTDGDDADKGDEEDDDTSFE